MNVVDWNSLRKILNVAVHSSRFSDSCVETLWTLQVSCYMWSLIGIRLIPEGSFWLFMDKRQRSDFTNSLHTTPEGPFRTTFALRKLNQKIYSLRDAHRKRRNSRYFSNFTRYVGSLLHLTTSRVFRVCQWCQIVDFHLSSMWKNVKKKDSETLLMLTVLTVSNSSAHSGLIIIGNFIYRIYWKFHRIYKNRFSDNF